MKYLLTVLCALLLLTSCSGNSSPTANVEEPSELASEAANSDSVEDAIATEDVEGAEDVEDAEDADKEDTEEKEDSKEDTAGLEQKNVVLEVSNQKTFGQITIKKVATSRDGWISIHKSRSDGTIQQPDSIGEARVDSGDSEDVVVDLWEAPAVGDKLWALLHIDAGERGTYEYPGKDAPVQKNGNMMARSFVIQGEKEKKGEEEKKGEDE